jgi:glutathione S-transferase
MLHQYKLVYFNGRGKAEPTRLLFAAAGVKYEDFRVDFSKWPEEKKSKLLF